MMMSCQDKDCTPVRTGVSFATDQEWLQTLYRQAAAVCRLNRKRFGGRQVLIEGSYYRHVWLETQPMGGEMYARRSSVTGLNNQLIFMEHQAANGRLPGMISRRPIDGLPGAVAGRDGLTAYYGWLQGFCFAAPAYRMAAYVNYDRDYLRRLYTCLEAFDRYLWTYRDSDGDGCLETWCVWDTGEDNSARFFPGSPDNWPGETPPRGRGRLPYESMDFMGYSCQCRDVLALLSRRLRNGREADWEAKAQSVRDKIRTYLWDEERYACFDRDCDNRVMDTLLHNNFRLMYFGGMSQDMADAFLREHLFNPAEFWTPLPLPSIARCDPLYDNNNDNNWSGQPQGLTYQRCVDAMLNYHHHAETVLLGRKWLAACAKSGVFAQQYDPQTMAPSVRSVNYGPSVLAALEYLTLMHGVLPRDGRLLWSAAAAPGVYRMTQRWGDRRYTLRIRDREMHASLDGKALFSCSTGCRVLTDMNGREPVLIGLGPREAEVRYRDGGGESRGALAPNRQAKPDGGALRIVREIPFDGSAEELETGVRL